MSLAVDMFDGNSRFGKDGQTRTHPLVGGKSERVTRRKSLSSSSKGLRESTETGVWEK